MMDMATDPAFEKYHVFKKAAIEKTFAFPTSTTFYSGSLSLKVFLILMNISLLFQVFILRKK